MKAVPVFRPTAEEFADITTFVDSIFDQCIGTGICKIVPPPGWKPSQDRDRYDNLDLSIPTPIRQVLQGRHGCFSAANFVQKALNVSQFRDKAEQFAKDCKVDGISDMEVLERKFWKNIQFGAPIYGADMTGSLFDEDVTVWNPQDLRSPLNLIGLALEGITKPYLYFGMWKAMFAWHTEDMDLLSINYLHFGKPKRWYAVGARQGPAFERAVSVMFLCCCPARDSY